ncbi:hypothetical protein BDW22DRAFT_1361283, partial [Trametopsis cervina]
MGASNVTTDSALHPHSPPPGPDATNWSLRQNHMPVGSRPAERIMQHNSGRHHCKDA